MCVSTYAHKRISEEFKSNHLSQRILDAYKSQSPLQLISKVRSLATQLVTLLIQQPSTISQLETIIVPIIEQTPTTDHVLDNDFLHMEKNISSNQYGK